MVCIGYSQMAGDRRNVWDELRNCISVYTVCVDVLSEALGKRLRISSYV
jgi:hypothetical protein